MLTADQQVPASFMQSQVAPGVGWNGVPCDSDMYAGSYNSGQIMNTSYAPSALRHHSHLPSWDMMTTAQRKWYQMQHDYQMNQMGMQTDMYHCQLADFCNSSIRYFEPPDERRQLSGRAVKTHTMCECTPLYPHGRTWDVGMPPAGMYGYTQVGMQQNYGCQQQMNRSDEFVNGKYGMPVVGNRKLTYHMPCEGPVDGSQNWNCGENVIKQRLMVAAGPQQFDAKSQQVTLTHQLNSSDCTGQRIVAEPVNSASVQVPAVAARRRQSTSSKKSRNNSSFTAQPHSKSKKLDSDAGELASAATWSGTLMNITSASLAHLAEGVENISAVMQQTLQHGGPFQSVQRPSDHVDSSADENANFIYGGDSRQIQAVAGGLNPVEQKTAHESGCTSVTSSVSAFQTSSNYSRCSVAANSSLSSVQGNASTTGIDVVVMSKAPYTISYRPTGISSGDSMSNVDVRNVAAFCHSATPRMMQQSNVARHMSSVDSVSFNRRQIPSSEGFSFQHQRAMTPCYNNPTDATKVDQHATAIVKCLPMASSVAVIQPQMMSGTQLFIADRCSESAPVLNNFVLPTNVPSSAIRSPQHFRSMQQDPNYQGFVLQHMPVSSSESVLVFCSSPNTVKQNTDPSLSDSVAGGSPLSRYSQTNVGGCHQPSVSVYSR